MFCPMCGAPNEGDATFCSNCGAALSPDQAEAVAAQVSEVGAGVEVGQEQAAAAVEGLAAVEPVPAPPSYEEAPPIPAAPPYAPPLVSPPTHNLAIASLVLGIAGLTVVPGIASIVAIVLGYMARKEIRSQPGQYSGEGMTTAGLVMGWIGVGLAVLGVVAVGAFTVCAIAGAAGAGY